ncbi:MAG: twin-arginine translocase subunit TatC [Pseudomonadota bacterium]|nr:twin-arginine translocase subunit TatC [Pseudomonadota bacterium]MDE3038437.1 twin-arginine translocase subunit TatC [Pseudomonadota bacterium]
MTIDLPRQPIIDHLIELRRRLVVCLLAFLAATVLCYLVAGDIYAILVRPLAEAFPNPEHRRLIYTSLTEPFLAYLKLAVFGGFMLSFPVIAMQLYRFLAPGLYQRERRAFIPYLVASPLLFIGGAAFAYYVIFPAAWRFFLSFESPAILGALPIQLEARVGDYLNIAMHLIIAFGLSFQLPVVLVLLVRAGILSLETLKRGRRYAVVIIVTIAAFITPPDIFSQIALSVPLYLLYEISIFVCRNMGKPVDIPT